MTDRIRDLWALHRELKTSRRRPDLAAQTLRARAAVDALIAELTALDDLRARTADGYLDLDHLTREDS